MKKTCAWLKGALLGGLLGSAVSNFIVYDQFSEHNGMEA